MLEFYYAFSESENISQKRYFLKQILYYVTGSTDIDVDSRGGNIDARDLNVIEAFMGREFEGVGGVNPNTNAAVILKDIYADIENQYYNILNMYSSLGGYVSSVFEYVDDNGNKFIDLELLYYIFDLKESNGENIDSLVYDLGIYLKSYDKMHGTSYYTEYKEHYSYN